MKRFILSILVSVCLIMASVSGAVVRAEAETTVQIVSITEKQDAIEVVFFCLDPVDGQTMTVVCKNQSDETDFLYVGQWENVADGINRRSFPVDSKQAEGTYIVTLGGDNITDPVSSRFTFGAVASQGYMAIGMNVTCAELFTQLGVTSAVASITVDGKTLDSNERVPAGAQLTLRVDSQEVISLLYVAGDVNVDRAINASDALSALQHSVRLITLDSVDFCAADVNFSGVVDALDALMILQYSVGLIQGF